MTVDTGDDRNPTVPPEGWPDWLAAASAQWQARGDRAAPTVAGVVSVAFHGEPAIAPLTWGQQHILAVVRAIHPWSGLYVTMSLPVHPDRTVGAVSAALAQLVGAQESLRTTFPDDHVQQVHGAGTLPLALLDCATTEPVRPQVELALAAVPDRLDTASPIRAALLGDADGRYLVLGVSHTAADRAALDTIAASLAHLSSAAAPLARPAGGRQPAEQARYEIDQRGRRMAERALHYAERALYRMPQSMLPRLPIDTGRPRFRQLQFESTAVSLACGALASRHGVTLTTVLYAAINTVAAHASGLSHGVLCLLLGNRLDPATHSAVGPYAQEVVAMTDIGEDFAATVLGTGARVLMALRNGCHPPAELARLRQRVQRDRGAELDLSYLLNDRRRGGVRSGLPAAADLATAARTSTLSWIDCDDRSNSTYFINADDGPHGSTRLRMILDTALLPPDEAVNWMLALERLLCAAVHAPVPTAEITAITGLAPSSRDPHWARVGPSWLDLRAVTGLVSEVLPGAVVDVFAEPGADGQTELVARLCDVSAEAAATVGDRCFDRVAGRRTAMVPHRFVVHRGVPRTRTLDGWRQTDSLVVVSDTGAGSGAAVARVGSR